MCIRDLNEHPHSPITTATKFHKSLLCSALTNEKHWPACNYMIISDLNKQEPMSAGMSASLAPPFAVWKQSRLRAWPGHPPEGDQRHSLVRKGETALSSCVSFMW